MAEHRSQSPEKSRLFTRNYVSILLLHMVGCTYAQGISSLLAVHTTGLGFTGAMTGYIISVFTLASMFLRPFSNRISSRLPSKPAVLCIWLLLGTFSLLIPAVDSFWGLIALRIGQGVAMCINGTITGTLIANVIPKDRFEEGMGYYSIGPAAMSFVAPFLGMMVMNIWGHKTLFSTIGVMMYLGILLAATIRFIPPAKEGNETKVRESILSGRFEPTAVIPSALLFINNVAHTAVAAYLLVFGTTRGWQQVPLFFAFGAVTALLTRLGFTLLRLGETSDRALGAIMAAEAGILLLIPSVRSTVILCVMGAMYGCTVGVIQPAFISRAFRHCPPSGRGAATATYYLGLEMGATIGGVLWGAVSDVWGYSSVFYGAAVLVLLDICFLILYARKEKNGRSGGLADAIEKL